MADDDVEKIAVPEGTPHAPVGMNAGNVLAPHGDTLRGGGSYGALPAMTAGMTFREIGSSGLRAFSGWVREEFLQQLVGRQAAQKFREMQDNSPTIGAIMYAIIATMRKVDWRTTPADDSPQAQEAADFIDSCRDDMSHTWEELVVENLSMLGYGFAPHEIVYKRRNGREPGPDPARPGFDLPSSAYDDGKIGWRRIPLRGQDTVIKWFFDENGSIEGVTQQPWIGPLIDIPIEKLLLFRPITHKNNPEGRSVLRSSYLPYYFCKRIQEQEAILAERLGGVPVVRVPSTLIDAAQNGDATAVATLNGYKQMVVNLRIDEQMGVIMPSDHWMGADGTPTSAEQYKFELVTPQIRASGIDFDKTVNRYNVQMMTSVLADFLQLGHEARGTQSLAVSKVDMFFQAVEGYLNANAAVYNRYAIPRLFRLNGMEEDLCPTLEPDLAQRVDLDVLSNFVLRLSQAGMPMFPNEELQNYILDAGGLPDVVDERALRAAGLADHQLENQDAKDEASLQRMTAPPPPPKPGTPTAPGGTPLEKMLLASIARRQQRYAGPRFGVTTKRAPTKRPGHVHARR
jgi:hypothetical protein